MTEKQSNQQSTGITIFLADDDEDDQQLLKEAFTSIDASIQFCVAENGKQALTCLDTLPNHQLPCLIVLDYNMPELNGAEVLQHIVKQGRYTDVPKIIWTTSNSPAHKEHCLRMGADAYLVKPDNIKDIENMARKMLQYCKAGTIS